MHGMAWHEHASHGTGYRCEVGVVWYSSGVHVGSALYYDLCLEKTKWSVGLVALILPGARGLSTSLVR